MPKCTYICKELYYWEFNCVYTCHRNISLSLSAIFFVYALCCAPGTLGGQKLEISTGNSNLWLWLQHGTNIHSPSISVLSPTRPEGNMWILPFKCTTKFTMLASLCCQAAGQRTVDLLKLFNQNKVKKVKQNSEDVGCKNQKKEVKDAKTLLRAKRNCRAVVFCHY